MSSGAQIGTYITSETTPGVTPDTPVWETLRLVSNGMTPTVNTERSEEIRETRMMGGSIITSQDYGGDLTAEMSAQTFDSLLEAAFYGDWTDDVLTIGSTRHTFSAVKAYKDIGVFTLFTGVHVSAMNLEIPEEGKLNLTFTTMGMGHEDLETNPTATGTVTPQTTTVPMGSATSIGEILIDGAVIPDGGCISSMTFSLDNTVQTQRCLGKVGPGALIATSANISGQFVMAWSKTTWGYYKRQFDRSSMGLQFPIQDPEGNSYLLNIPEIEVDGELPDGGNEEIVEATLNYVAKNQPVTLTRVVAGEGA